MKKPIAYFDMDDTLVQYTPAIERDYNLYKGPNDPGFSPENKKIPYLRKRIDLIRSVPGWWLSLEPHQPGFEILEVCKELGFEIRVASRGPNRCDNAWMEKFMWCKKYLPGVGVTITLDKSVLLGDLLVEDYPEYLDAWLENNPKSHGIIMPYTRNSDYEHDRVFEYRNSPQDLKERLEVVYDNILIRNAKK
jgi:hypothetical protein